MPDQETKADAGLALGKAMPGPAALEESRMEVVDYVKWGNLIKKWSRNPETAPKDLQDFAFQCSQAGVGLSMPPSITEIKVIVQKDNEFVLRLPPPNAIKATEEALKAGGLYPIPHFYNQRFGAILNVDTEKEKMDFHAQRIGDYIIRKTA